MALDTTQTTTWRTINADEWQMPKGPESTNLDINSECVCCHNDSDSGKDDSSGEQKQTSTSTGEDLEKEIRKLTNAYVVLNEAEVMEWRLQKATEYESFKMNHASVCLDPTTVPNWLSNNIRPQVRPRVHPRVRSKKELVIIKPKSARAANLKYWKENRKLNINRKSPRKDIVNSDVVQEVSQQTHRVHACDLCDRSYTHKKSLVYHKKYKHLNVRRYRCEICGRKFLNKSQFVIHVNRHQNKKSFKCNRCVQSYYSRSELNFHKKTCGRNDPQKCNLCGRYLASIDCLRHHLIEEMSNRVYQCDICGVRTKHYESMYNHYAAQHPDCEPSRNS